MEEEGEERGLMFIMPIIKLTWTFSPPLHFGETASWFFNRFRGYCPIMICTLVLEGVSASIRHLYLVELSIVSFTSTAQLLCGCIY